MKKIGGVVFLLLLLSNLFAQQDSTLVFYNETEKDVFNKVQSNQADFRDLVSLMMLTNKEASEESISMAKGRIERSIKNFRSHGSAGSYKKISRLIFKTVHNDYFVKYQETADFSDIFTNGSYNCASATALFALIATELNLPQSIRERPDHVFLIIDPENTAMVLESTLPVGGVYYFDTSRYTKMLLDLKLISAEEARNRNANEVYEKYLQDVERTISLSQLIGDLYYNTAVLASQTGDYLHAYNQINKAAILNSSSFINNLKSVLTLVLFEIEIENRTLKYHYANQILKAKKFNESVPEHLLGYFDNMSYQQLITDNNKADYLLNYREISHLFKEYELTELQGELLVTHHKRLAEYYSLKNQNELCLAHLDTLYSLRPNDLVVQSNVTIKVVQSLSNLTANPEKIDKAISSYLEKYPFLENNPIINEFKMIGISFAATNDLRANKLSMGLKHLENFKALIPEEGASNYVQQHLGTIYAEIGSYYVRARNDNAAKKWFLDGLKVAPESTDLKRKWRSFEEYELYYKQR